MGKSIAEELTADNMRRLIVEMDKPAVHGGLNCAIDVGAGAGEKRDILASSHARGKLMNSYFVLALGYQSLPTAKERDLARALLKCMGKVGCRATDVMGDEAVDRKAFGDLLLAYRELKDHVEPLYRKSHSD